MSKFNFPHNLVISLQSTEAGDLPEQASTMTVKADVQPFRPSSSSPEFGIESTSRVKVYIRPMNNSPLKTGNLFTWKGEKYAFETNGSTADDGFGLAYSVAIAVRSEYA